MFDVKLRMVRSFMGSPENVQVATFLILVVTAVLVVIVAIGNRQLYSRVEKMETILELQGMPQSQQTTLQVRQSKKPE